MAKKPKTAFLAKIDKTPPFLCRAMAVKTGKGLRPTRIPVATLSKRSGIPIRTIEALSYKPSWEGIKAGTISAFAEACNVDLLHRERTRRWMRVNAKYNFSFLTSRQRKLLDKLCETI